MEWNTPVSIDLQQGAVNTSSSYDVVRLLFCRAYRDEAR